jgi:hypothetical protein
MALITAKRALILGLTIAIVTGSSAAYFAGTVPVSGDIPLTANSGLTVIFAGYSTLPDADFESDGMTIENQTIRSSGSASARLEERDVEDSNFTNLTEIDATQNQISINRTTEPLSEVRVSGDIVEANLTTVGFDDGLDFVLRASSENNQVSLRIDRGSALVVDTTTDEIVAESFSDADGFVTFSLPAGQHQLELEEGPEKVFVRPVDRPQEFLDGANVSVEFYQQGGDTVRSRSGTLNGSINTFGLPLNEAYVAQASDDGFIERRAAIDSIREQNSVYLLNQSVTSHQIRFSVTDLTGEFGPGSILKIERALNTSDTEPSELEYQAVAGERISRGGGYETFLEDGVRYRVTVIGEDGEDTRQLGVFVPRSDRLIDLEIGTLDYSFDEDTEDGTLITSIDGEDTTAETLTVAYRDESNSTSVLRGTIHERGNVSNQFSTFAAPSSAVPLGTFTFAVNVSAAGGDNETAYVANATIVQQGNEETVVKPFGASQYPIGLPLDDGWRQITGVGFLIVLAGAFSVANARIGAIILPGVALLMWMIGFLDGVVTLGAIALAMTIAVGYSWAMSSREVLG